MEKILITGLGMVGYELINKLSNNYEIHVLNRSNKEFFNNYNNIYKYPIDITNKNKLNNIINKINPDVIINTAAYTHVDNCEIDKKIAYNVNALSVEHLGKIAKSLNIPLHHISTDYVFNGEKGNYLETDEINPINYYGYTKAQGEKLLLNLNYDNVSIIRISTPYGISPVKVNFFMWVLNSLKNNEKVNIVNNQFNTSTYILELCEYIKLMIEKEIYGIYHIGSANKLSRYEFALKIQKIFNLNEDLIHPVSSASMNWKAKRPMDTSLNSKKIENKLNKKLKTVDECLEELKKM